MTPLRPFKFSLRFNYWLVATFTFKYFNSQPTIETAAYSKVYLTMLSPYVLLVLPGNNGRKRSIHGWKYFSNARQHTYVPVHGNDHLVWTFCVGVLVTVERSQNAQNDLQDSSTPTR